MKKETHHIVSYTPSGVFIGIIAGCGRNKGTWDSAHSKRTAQRHARDLNKRGDECRYVVEPLYG